MHRQLRAFAVGNKKIFKESSGMLFRVMRLWTQEVLPALKCRALCFCTVPKLD